MLQNRDTHRIHKDNKFIQACLFSRISIDTIKLLATSGANYTPDDQSLQLLKMAKKGNQMLQDNF